MKLKGILLALAITAGIGASAQVSASSERFSPLAEGYLERARTMLTAGNYSGVIDQLKMLSTKGVSLSEAQEEEYVHMLAQACYERGDAECVSLLRGFVSDYPASTLAPEARRTIGDYYFFHHQWSEALAEYDNLDFGRLNREDFALYTYRRGLTQIKTGHYTEARDSFHKLDGNSRYRNAYIFYTAYLDYIDGKFDDAYDGFSRVRSGEKGLEAAYYLTQIDYTRGKFEEVAQRGSSLISSLPDKELAPELNRVTGLSYFKLGDYTKARGYLDTYASLSTGALAPDAVYALGVIDYNNGDYTAAAERFSGLTELNNDLAQSAWLYLGQCDVQTGNNDGAAIAFEKAARMDYDRDVSEVALYNYVAALTRGGSAPFASSVDMLEGFIKLYPDSEYTPKVEEYLATAYYNERNYSKALANIEKIRHPSKGVLGAKQKILYELGIESMTNGHPDKAASYLKRSLELASYDRSLASQTQLWLGDAEYSLGNYSKATAAYNSFLKSEKNGANRTLALYNLAYSEYQQEKYSAAASTFAKAVAARPALPAALKSDAVLRMADCQYYTGNYRAARDNYATAKAESTSDADYASYRHAVMLGLGGDIKNKIKELSEIETLYPQSRWMPNVLLEKALTYEALDQNSKAADVFNRLASEYPKSVQARKAMINLALTYTKAGKHDQAADTYKEIIRNWPSSEEASLANDDLRKYYASRGELLQYAEFLKSVPEAKQLDGDEMEQLAFDSAETKFAENSNDISLLRNYVRDYPDGKYLAPALLDMASSLRASGKSVEAEEMLTRLAAERPHSVQYPEALLMKAEILETDIPGRANEATEVYKALAETAESDFIADAYAGIARTSQNDKERIEYARKARSLGGLAADQSEELELLEAMALLRSGNGGEALKMLENLAANPSGLAGAKAAVELGQYYVDKKEYAEAEKILLAFTDAGTPHEFQLAKGFILLADVYKAQGKGYLAKEYLRSLRDNYPGKEPEILNAINSRLKTLK